MNLSAFFKKTPKCVSSHNTFALINISERNMTYAYSYLQKMAVKLICK